MPLLTFPGSSVLVQRVIRLHVLKASGAYKYPPLGFIDANTVKNIVCLHAPFTRLGSNAFNGHMIITNLCLAVMD